MTSRLGPMTLRGALLLATLIAAGRTGLAGITDDFTLAKAIPADAMVVMHARDHAGREFVKSQYKRIWAAVERQQFDRAIRLSVRKWMEGQGQDTAAFDEQWQKLTDVMSLVSWSTLCERECAFAMKLGLPSGIDFVVLAKPSKVSVDKQFEGLTRLLKQLQGMAPEGTLLYAGEGEGDDAVHRLSIAHQFPPMAISVARHDDVILVGFGPTMLEQSLAMLRGDATLAGATLGANPRYQAALERLPAPADQFYYADMSKLVGQLRVFAAMAAGQMAGGGDGDGEPVSPLAWLPKLVEMFDLWEYAAGASYTDGLKCTGLDVLKLNAGADGKPIYRAIYGDRKLSDPLKFVPANATSVMVNAGVDLLAVYQAIRGFVRRELPNGEAMLAAFDAQMEASPFHIEKDLLGWVGGGVAMVSVPGGRSQYAQAQTLLLFDVRDEEAARTMLDRVCDMVAAQLQSQGGTVEASSIEGFKQIILPLAIGMIVGRPIVGVRDGHLLVATGPESAKAAIAVVTGEADGFAKSQRYRDEGLPLGDNVVAFQFDDLTKWGSSTSAQVQVVSLALRTAGAAETPAANAAILLLSKIGNVLNEFDFLLSSCSVKTREGDMFISRSVTNYREKPRRTTEPAPAAAPASEPAGESTESVTE